MPTLSIKDVPEEVAEALRQRARRHHRSLQGELMALVVEAAAQAPGDIGAAWASSRQASMGELRPAPGLKAIEQIAREHLARHPRPVRAGPSASRRLRAERDAS